MSASSLSRVEPDEITRRLRAAGVPPRFGAARFASFERRPGTVRALEASQEVVTGSKSLLLSGPPGTGKTHLAVSVLAARIEAFLAEWPAAYRDVVDPVLGERVELRPDLALRFIVVPFFLDRLRAAMHYAERADPLPALYTADLVVLDDLGREKATDWATERLYVLINERYNHFLPTIATTNYTPQELADRGYKPHVSRLAEGRLVSIDASDYRRRRP